MIPQACTYIIRRLILGSDHPFDIRRDVIVWTSLTATFPDRLDVADEDYTKTDEAKRLKRLHRGPSVEKNSRFYMFIICFLGVKGLRLN